MTILVSLTSREERLKIDIGNKIRRELARFPRLDCLEHAFDDYFKQIEETYRPALAILNWMLL